MSSIKSHDFPVHQYRTLNQQAPDRQLGTTSKVLQVWVFPELRMCEILLFNKQLKNPPTKAFKGTSPATCYHGQCPVALNCQVRLSWPPELQSPMLPSSAT